MSAQDTLRELLEDCAFDADDAETASETLVYRPAEGDARSIQGIVTREQRGDIGRASAPAIRITVLNDTSAGIGSNEIDDGADQIDVATKYGATATTRNIYRVVSHNAGFVTIECK